MRRHSSLAVIRVAPGRVDCPPMSMISTFAAIMAFMERRACFSFQFRPPSEKESGVMLMMPMIKGPLEVWSVRDEVVHFMILNLRIVEKISCKKTYRSQAFRPCQKRKKARLL